MSDCGWEIENAGAGERRLLFVLLAINAIMFAIELAAGIAADSAGLLADSLDMLADATVYGIALAAVGRAASAKARAALFSGYFQIDLTVWVGAEVLRRFLGGSEPQSTWMIAVGALSLAANVACLAMLAKHRKGEIHLRASFICSSNDVLANVAPEAWPEMAFEVSAFLPREAREPSFGQTARSRWECQRASSGSKLELRPVPEDGQSEWSVVFGSNRAARRAGIEQARTTVAREIATARRMAPGSEGEFSKSTVVRNRPPTIAPRTPRTALPIARPLVAFCWVSWW